MLTISYADNFLGPPLDDSQHPSDKKFQTASILAPLSIQNFEPRLKKNIEAQSKNFFFKSLIVL